MFQTNIKVSRMPMSAWNLIGDQIQVTTPAAIVTPIARLAGDGFDVTLDGDEVTGQILEELGGIQRGTIPDRHGWMYQLV